MNRLRNPIEALPDSLASLPQLEKLDLFATHIDDRALEHISRLTSLKYLDIRSTGYSRGKGWDMYGAISENGLELISQLPNLETLRTSGHITDHGL